MKLRATTHKFRKLRKTRGIWESSAGKEWRYLENLRLLVNLANIMSLMTLLLGAIVLIGMKYEL